MNHELHTFLSFSATPLLTQLAINNFDYCFAENGLTAFKLGEPLPAASFIEHVGEEEYKKLANFILRYLSEVDVPVKR
jgi:phosphomannomutase